MAIKMLKKELIRMNRITQGTNIKYVGEDGQVLEISPQTLLFKPNKNVQTPTPVKDKARVNPKSLVKGDSSSTSEAEDGDKSWLRSRSQLEGFGEFSESEGTLELTPTCRVRSFKRKAC